MIRMTGAPFFHLPVIRPVRFSRAGMFALILLIPLLISCAGCVRMESLTARTSPSPEKAWTPPPDAGARAIAAPAVEIPPRLDASRQRWTLSDLVDLGLGNNMQTRIAWGAARSAAAALGAVRGAYFPKLAVDVNAAKTKGSAVGGRFVYDYSSLTPTAGLTWLLFDFGGRGGLTEEARQALSAANWTQNTAIQNVILQIEQNYYQYLAAKALLQAQDVSLKEAEKNLEAADARHAAGVATLADTLQAKTAASGVRLALVSTQGLLQALKGALANAVGLPANTPFEVADELAASLPLDQASGAIENYIAQAQAKRPDLAAARALALRADAHVKTVRSDGLPTLAFNGSFGRVYYSTPAQSSSLNAAVLLDIPLSRGLTNSYQVLQAQSDAENAKAQMKKVEQDVVLQVWTSYYNVQTAAQSITTAQDLYDTAEQAYQVSLAGYKQGVGSILDLLAAQSALENGRLQIVQAKVQWLTSIVQFAHDTGTLDVPGQASAAPGKGDR
jgi:outer membrane protein TolC